MLPAKFHVVSRLLTVLKIDASVKVPVALPLKICLLENEATVNLKSASFIVIMLLYEGLTHIQSQITPRLLFGESFTLTWYNVNTINYRTTYWFHKQTDGITIWGIWANIKQFITTMDGNKQHNKQTYVAHYHVNIHRASLLFDQV